MSNLLDRVLETTSTTGTGAYALGGPAAGFRGFAAAMADPHVIGDKAFYFCFGAPDGADAGSWEFGFGTVAGGAPDTIARSLIRSNTGSLIAWSAGVKYIMSTPPANLLMQLCRPARGETRPAWLPAGSFWIKTDAAPHPVLFWYDGADDLACLALDETANRAYPLDAVGARLSGPEVDVPSAATAAIGAAASDRVRITGTIGIAAFDTASAGVRRRLRFQASLTLAHDAAKLILPGGQNIVAAAEDEAAFVSLGAGNWKCTHYLRADGQLVAATISPPALAATTHDYDPPGLNLASVLRVSTDASRALTGLAAPSPPRHKQLLLFNTGSHDLVLEHDQGSSAANRFLTPDGAGYTLRSNTGAALFYDPASSRWRLGAAPQPAVQTFTARFTSADQVISPGGALPPIVHGLGAQPFGYGVELVCQADELGYAAGQVTPVYLHGAGGGNDSGVSIVADATHLHVRYGSTAAVWTLLRADNGNLAGIDPARWKARFKAWL